MTDRKLTAERLRELLQYDASTGLFSWIKRSARGSSVQMGRNERRLTAKGYCRIRVDGELVMAHRLAWLYSYGEWPKGEVLHKNGIRHDNRLANLEDVILTRKVKPAAQKQPNAEDVARLSDAELVRVLFDFDPLTGLMINRFWRGPKKAGTEAGTAYPGGYRRILFRDKLQGTHRLAWLYMQGRWPEGEIDHINGDPSDNRIANLRDVSRALNAQNRTRANRGAAAGLLGVTLNRRAKRKKWNAVIRTDGRAKRLGSFETAEEAHQAYLAAKRELHPGFVSKD